MDSEKVNTSARLKKVSFQEMEAGPGPLRRMPSQPNLVGLQPPQVHTRTMFLTPGQVPALPLHQPSFSSFKGEQKPEASIIQKLDSSSVLSKLLSDSFVAAPKDPKDGTNDRDNKNHIDENMNNITNVFGNDKYYF